MLQMYQCEFGQLNISKCDIDFFKEMHVHSALYKVEYVMQSKIPLSFAFLLKRNKLSSFNPL